MYSGVTKTNPSDAAISAVQRLTASFSKARGRGGGWDRIVEERHRKITKVEEPHFDPLALTEVLKNPLRRFQLY